MNPAIHYKNRSDKTQFWMSSLCIKPCIKPCIKSVIGTLLWVAIGISSAQANPNSSELALAQLLKDIEKIDTELSTQAEGTEALADGYYLIRRGDTLDRIIHNVVPKTSLRKSILRQAIVRANPHAFKRSNPNWMYANKRIKLPDSDDIKGVIFASTPGNKEQQKTVVDKKDWIRYP